MKVGKIMLGMCQTNCYYLYEEGSKEAVFVDPADQGAYLYEQVQKAGLQIAGILLTHGHFDHIWGANELRKLSGAKIYALDVEKALCENAETNLSAQCGRPETVIPDVYVRDGEEITLAGMTAKVIATPGHTVGSCCYYFAKDKALISGDTLFLDGALLEKIGTAENKEEDRSAPALILVLAD